MEGESALKSRIATVAKAASRVGWLERLGALSGRTLLYGTLLVASLVSLFPLVWVMTNSLKRPVDTFVLPPVLLFQPTLQSYQMLFSSTAFGGASILLYLRNSLIVAGVTTLLSIGAGLLAAYALARFSFRGKNGLGLGIILTRMLPPIATIVPLFILMSQMGLLDTYVGLIFAYSAINLPFAAWMLRGFINEIPSELDEAAMIDGCSRLGALWRILLPVMGPGIAATSVFVFLLSWNEFPLALILTSRESRTLPLLVMHFLTDEGIAWGPMSAAATLTLLPPVLFVIFAQRHLAKGLTMGSVKG